MNSRSVTVQLGEIAEIRNGAGIKQSNFSDSGTPLAKVSNFTSDSVELVNPTYVELNHASKWKEHLLKAGDILVATVGSWPPNWSSVVGKVVRVPTQVQGAIQNQNTACILPDAKSVDKDFLYYRLRSPDFLAYVSNAAGGSANQARIAISNLKKFSIDLPVIEEQREIGRFLKLLDQRQQLNNHANRILEQIAQTLFKSWFVDFDPVRAKVAVREHFEQRAAENGEPLPAPAALEEAQNIAAAATIAGLTFDPANIDGTRALLEAKLAGMEVERRARLMGTAALFPGYIANVEGQDIPEGWRVEKLGALVKRLKPKKKYTKKNVNDTGSTIVLEQGAGLVLGFTDEDADFKATPDEPMFIFGDHTCVMKLCARTFSVSANVIPLKGDGLPTNWVFYACLGKQEFQEYRRHWSEFVIKEAVVPSYQLCVGFSDICSALQQKIDQNFEESRVLESVRNTLLPRLLSGELQLNKETVAEAS